MKNFSKKLFATMMLFFSFSIMSLCASAAVNYPVWVGSTQVSSENMNDVLGNGRVKYAPKTNTQPATLYLNNAVIESYSTIEGPEFSSYLLAKEDLVINLTGDNRIGPVCSTVDELRAIAHFGIRATNYGSFFNSITLTGSGNLKIYDKATGIIGKKIVLNFSGKLSILEYGNMELACCLKTVINDMQDPGTTYLQNGTLQLESLNCNGVYGNLQISGGTIEAYAKGIDPGLSIEPHYAFTAVPVYTNGFKPSIYAGETPAGAKPCLNPTNDTYKKSKYVKITKAPAAPPEKKILGSLALDQESFVYNGGEQKPSVKVTTSDGILLKEGADYTITYPEKCSKIGSYAVSVTGKGNYTGTLSKTYQIVPKGISFKKAKGIKKGFQLKWRTAAKGITGYQIEYSTNNQFTNAKVRTIKKRKTVSFSKNKLPRKVTYYVRIRTYQEVSKVPYYSPWSKTKQIRTK